MGRGGFRKLIKVKGAARQPLGMIFQGRIKNISMNLEFITTH